MQEFKLILSNQKHGFYNRFAIFILMLCGLSTLLLLGGMKNATYTKIIGIISSVVILASLFAFTRPTLAKFRLNALFNASMYLSAHFFQLHGYWWASILLFILVIFYYKATYLWVVKVQESGIFYPSFPTKYIAWHELSNVILKDGILTIDFRNNRIIQQELDENMDAPNATDFNEFCRQQLQNGNVPA